MSKASRERECQRNEKFQSEASIISKVCKVLKKDITLDEKLDLLNHIIIGTNQNDWNLRMQDQKNWDIFDEKLDLKTFSGVVVPHVKKDSLVIEAVGTDQEFYKKIDNNMTEDEMMKIFNQHEIKLNLEFKTPVGIARILKCLGSAGDQIISNN